jgi:hypothetical protein
VPEVRNFILVRDEDVSGVSGTGVVAEGTKFSNGLVVVSWVSEWPTVTTHVRGMESVEFIHGHCGKTRVVWLDSYAPVLSLARGA